MKKVVIVYWSSTGNTEQMAQAVAQGAQSAGAQVELVAVARAQKELLAGADAIGLGCPSMGNEVLDEDEMEPFVASITADLIAGKPTVLFGSYDWGDGQWMRDWEKRMSELGAKLVGHELICQLEPDDTGRMACQAAGKALAS